MYYTLKGQLIAYESHTNCILLNVHCMYWCHVFWNKAHGRHGCPNMVKNLVLRLIYTIYRVQIILTSFSNCTSSSTSSSSTSSSSTSLSSTSSSFSLVEKFYHGNLELYMRENLSLAFHSEFDTVYISTIKHLAQVLTDIAISKHTWTYYIAISWSEWNYIR